MNGKKLSLAALFLSGSLVSTAFAQAPAPPANEQAPAPIERQTPEAPAPPPPGPRGPSHFRPMGHHGPQGMGGRMGMLPPGMWWERPETVQRLGLSADQVKRIDDIFQKSRLQLVDLKANLEKQNLMLEPLLNANPVDQANAMAQIDKVADARADLEKANAKMLLGIRSVLTPEQWTKLHSREDRGPGGQGGAMDGGSGGRRGMRGPGGPQPVAPNTDVER